MHTDDLEAVEAVEAAQDEDETLDDEALFDFDDEAPAQDEPWMGDESPDDEVTAETELPVEPAAGRSPLPMTLLVPRFFRG